MNIDQARKHLGDILEVVVKGEHYIGKLDDVEVTYKFGGHEKATICMINTMALTHRDEPEGFNLEDISKFRVVDGKWQR